MPARMIPQMWAAMRTLAYILQLVGLLGLIGTGFMVLMSKALSAALRQDATGRIEYAGARQG